MGGDPSQTEWAEAIRTLAGFERPSASEGERRAAEWIAAALRRRGLRTVVERERAHGGYWWPLGLANALAAAGGALAARRRARRAGRIAGAIAAGIGAAAVWDDVGGGRLWFRRALLGHRPTWNVVAEAGTPEAARTVVFIAHHDAAHSGLVFHPAFGALPPKLAPRLHERPTQSFPILYAVWLGPVLIAAGAALGVRRLIGAGTALALGAACAMAEIGAAAVVPGANDNLSAVAVLLALAHAFEERPPAGVRVVLLSTGSEESFMEGMQAYARRHFAEFDRDRTEFICLECVGGPTLMVLEGEGMLRMRHYPQPTREGLAAAAERAGVAIARGLRTVAATDALIALRAGFPTATLASVDYTKLPLNYHWPTDRPEALRWTTIDDAIAVCESFVRIRERRVSRPAASSPPTHDIRDQEDP